MSSNVDKSLLESLVGGELLGAEAGDLDGRRSQITLWFSGEVGLIFRAISDTDESEACRADGPRKEIGLPPHEALERYVGKRLYN